MGALDRHLRRENILLVLPLGCGWMVHLRWEQHSVRLLPLARWSPKVIGLLCLAVQTAAAAGPASSQSEVLHVLVVTPESTSERVDLPVQPDAQVSVVAGSREFQFTVRINPEEFVSQVPIEDDQKAVCVVVEDPNKKRDRKRYLGRPCLVVDTDAGESSLSWSRNNVAVDLSFQPEE